MPDPTAAPAAGPWRWSRRTVLLAGLAVGSSGCSLSDPAIRGAGGAAPVAPRPTPSPLAPGLARDLAAELALAARARAQRASTDADDDRRRDLLQLMERTHTERATALAHPDPASRPTTPEGTAGPSTVPAAAPGTDRLRADERTLARRYRAAALAAQGPTALLWGSMAVASTSFAAGLAADEPPASAAVAAHRPFPVVSDSAAVSALVAALHAAVWGYQLALGKLPADGAGHDRALRGLRDRRVLQHRLVDRLRRAGVEVPAAAPAYDPDPEVRDADDARLLLRRMESRLLPFCGAWLAAAARPADRAAALDALTRTAATATAWGAPLQAWPGWGD